MCDEGTFCVVQTASIKSKFDHIVTAQTDCTSQIIRNLYNACIAIMPRPLRVTIAGHSTL